jgi:prepilin-type N-terminal cleavage/methylation domain-containing protein
MLARADRGFSLVENLVALMLLSVGLLALTSAVASVARLSGLAVVRTHGAAVGASQLEAIVAGGCSVGSGDSTIGRFSMRWTVAAAGAAADVLIAVRSPTPRGWRTDTLITRVPCRS